MVHGMVNQYWYDHNMVTIITKRKQHGGTPVSSALSVLIDQG